MDTKKDKKLQIRLDEDLWKAVQDACKKENRTLSNLIRTALIAYLNN